MTLLTLVQDAAVKLSINRPTAVIGSTDATVRRLLSFANEEGRDLASSYDWQSLRKEQTFTTVAAETQTNAIPTDFDRFVNETFWNRTRRRPLTGPVDARQWQAVKAWTTSPVTDTFTYRGSNILVNPTPAAGQTMAFEYISKNWCESSGGTDQNEWAADTDVGLLPEYLMALGIVWRFRQAMGAPYQDNLSIYTAQVDKAFRKQRPASSIDMSGGIPRAPGINVPEGNWSL